MIAIATLNWVQTVSVISACAVCTYMVGRVCNAIIRGVWQIVGEVKRILWEHDQMWVDYCVAHNIPIRTDSKGRRKVNGDAKSAVSGGIV